MSIKQFQYRVAVHVLRNRQAGNVEYCRCYIHIQHDVWHPKQQILNV